MRKVAAVLAASILVAGCGPPDVQVAPPSPTPSSVPFVPAWLDYLQHGQPPPGTYPVCDKTWQDLMWPGCDVGGK